MTLRLYFLSSLLCFLLAVSNTLTAQNIPDRTVYWVHDINEDIPYPNTAFTTNAYSYFWQHYAGLLYPISCPQMDATKPNAGSYFRTTRFMDPHLVNFYSDPFVPPKVFIAGRAPRFSFYHTPGLERITAGNSKSVTQLADSILSSSAMPQMDGLEIPVVLKVS